MEPAGREDKSMATESRRRSPSRSSSAKGPALDELSNECISRVGVNAVGQEYTGMLKVLGKRLDLALRQVLHLLYVPFSLLTITSRIILSNGLKSNFEKRTPLSCHRESTAATKP